MPDHSHRYDHLTKEELIAVVQRFEALRNCPDRKCTLCATCVNNLFTGTPIPANRIPAKFYGEPWRIY